MRIDERSSKKEVLAAVAKNGRALRFASAELLGDRDVVLTAVAQDGTALMHASAELRGDRGVVLKAVAQRGDMLSVASPALMADREVVLAAVAQDGSALGFVSDELRGDREVFYAAVRVPERIVGILLRAILNNPSLIQFFPTIPDEEIKSFFEEIDCRAKTLPLPTYIDENSLDKIQLFIKAQGGYPFTVKLPNKKEIDYKFKTSLAEQMLGAINWQSSSEPEPEPEPEPEHSEILINDANHRRQINPAYFEKIKTSLYGLFLPMLRKTVVSKIPEDMLRMLFGLRLQDMTFCLFEHLTTKDLSKYVQVCRATRGGDFIGDEADSAGSYENPLYGLFREGPFSPAAETFSAPSENKDHDILAEQPEKYIQHATSENTRRAYQSDIKHFLAWGGQLPTTPEELKDYIVSCAPNLNPRTLKRLIITLQKWHRLQKNCSDPTNNPAVIKTMKGISRVATTIFIEKAEAAQLAPEPELKSKFRAAAQVRR